MWRLGDFFANLATSGSLLRFFEKMKQLKDMSTFWATFLHKHFFKFYVNKHLQNTVCYILRFQKWFDVDALDFQIEL